MLKPELLFDLNSIGPSLNLLQRSTQETSPEPIVP